MNIDPAPLFYEYFICVEMVHKNGDFGKANFGVRTLIPIGRIEHIREIEVRVGERDKAKVTILSYQMLRTVRYREQIDEGRSLWDTKVDTPEPWTDLPEHESAGKQTT